MTNNNPPINHNQPVASVIIIYIAKSIPHISSESAIIRIFSATDPQSTILSISEKHKYCLKLDNSFQLGRN